MDKEDFPALYRSASALSLESQTHFFIALKWHLILLMAAAILTIINVERWEIPLLQLLTLLGALSCSVYLFSKRPDRYWYAGRAVAESIKTITWRYVCRAEPFNSDDVTARSDFNQKLKAIVDHNKDVAQALTTHLDEPQITKSMADIRTMPLDQRKVFYTNHRITNQLEWYAKKASFNRKASKYFFIALILTNSVAVLFAVLRIKFVSAPFWPTDFFVVLAASLLSWMQAKRFSELASSYALAAHEISLIREQAQLPDNDEAFSIFVGDSENAFSREHTQWIARRDV